MRNRYEVEFDIWNNITYLKMLNFWVKQSFIGNRRVEFEDSDGNYWVEHMNIECTFLTYINKIKHIDPFEMVHIRGERGSLGKNIYIVASSLWIPSREMVNKALKTPLIMTQMNLRPQ